VGDLAADQPAKLLGCAARRFGADLRQRLAHRWLRQRLVDRGVEPRDRLLRRAMLGPVLDDKRRVAGFEDGRNVGQVGTRFGPVTASARSLAVLIRSTTGNMVMNMNAEETTCLDRARTRPCQMGQAASGVSSTA
jgi:hypothetical protein